MENACKKCGVMFESPSLIFELVGADILLRQMHCDACIDDFEKKSESCTRINLEDLIRAIDESL